MVNHTINVARLVEDGLIYVGSQPPSHLSRETPLSQLNLDSVSLAELLIYVEERLSVRLPGDRVATIETLGDLTRLIQAEMPGTRVDM
jgi:acyl carrier protein